MLRFSKHKQMPKQVHNTNQLNTDFRSISLGYEFCIISNIITFLPGSRKCLSSAATGPLSPICSNRSLLAFKSVANDWKFLLCNILTVVSTSSCVNVYSGLEYTLMLCGTFNAKATKSCKGIEADLMACARCRNCVSCKMGTA